MVFTQPALAEKMIAPQVGGRDAGRDGRQVEDRPEERPGLDRLVEQRRQRQRDDLDAAARATKL